jgi:hypothetical protein
MSSKESANDANGEPKTPRNERRPGLRDRFKLKTPDRKDGSVRSFPSATSKPNATNLIPQEIAEDEADKPLVPVNKKQKAIENKQKALQQKLKKMEDAVQVQDQRDAKTRNQAHNARSIATAEYEDYLYYQTPQHRFQYDEGIDAAVKKRRNNIIARGQPPARLSGDEKMLMPKLKLFNDNGVGMLKNLNWQAVPPHELRMRIPRAKRFSVGLGARYGMEPVEPINLRLDVNAIEKRRKEVEDENKDPQMDESHSERRKREVELLGRLPTDTFVNHAIPTAKYLGRTRLESGLFIAAGETADDWTTSYDQLDVVAPGRILDLPGTYAPELPTRGFTANEMEQIVGTDGEPTSEELHEFCKPKTAPYEYHPRIDDDYLEVTSWAEATYGRRERDVYERMPPCSPINSPPHSPVKSTPFGPYVPNDVSRAQKDFRAYQKRFKDPYGSTSTDWPSFKSESKGKDKPKEDGKPGEGSKSNERHKPEEKGKPKGEGFRIVYEPLDVAALPENHQREHHSGEGLLNEAGRLHLPAPDGTSMRLLREALSEPYGPPTTEKMPDEDDDSSDDGFDLFTMSYRECSGLGACSCGDDDDGGNSGDGGSGGGDGGSGGGGSGGDDSDGNKGDEKKPDDIVAPVIATGGSHTKPKPRPKTPGVTAKPHNYKQYNRVQLRTALKYQRQTQSSKTIEELYKRAETYDKSQTQGSLHRYIIKDRKVAQSHYDSISKMADKWWDAYQNELDKQNEQAEESEENQEIEQEQAEEETVEIDQPTEEVDTGKKSTKPAKAKKKKKASPKSKKKK